MPQVQDLLHAGGFIALGLFIPVLSFTALRVKDIRAQSRLSVAAELYNLKFDISYQIYQKIANKKGSELKRVSIPLTVLTLVGLYFSAVMIYTPKLISSPEYLYNLLLLGSGYITPRVTPSEVQGIQDQTNAYVLKTFSAMCYAYLGWYIWTISTIFSRMVTLELVTATYYSIVIRLITAIFVAVVFRHMLSSLSSFAPELIGFGVGVFPDAAFIFITRWLRKVLLRETTKQEEDFPLDLIQGISPFRKYRLLEIGMDNCENLAAANVIELYVSSNLALPEVIDWVGQAQLVVLIGRKILFISKGTVIELP